MARGARRRTVRRGAAVAGCALGLLAVAPAAALAATNRYLDSEERPPTTLGLWLGLIILVLVLVVVPLAIRSSRVRRDRPRRLPAVAGSASASDAAPDLSTPTVRGDAESLFREVQAAWDARDRERLADLVAPALLDRWSERLEAGAEGSWDERVKVVGPVDVELVAAAPPQGSSGPRVSVRVQTRMSGSLDPVVLEPHVQRAARRRAALAARQKG